MIMQLFICGSAARHLARQCLAHAPGVILTALMLFGAPAITRAEKVGPVPIKVSVNNVDIDLITNTTAKIYTRRGDFGVDGEIVASAEADELARKLKSASESLLPISLLTNKSGNCALLLNRISSLQLAASTDSTVHVDAEAGMSIDCGFKDIESVRMHFFVYPTKVASHQIKLQISSKAKFELPPHWWTVLAAKNLWDLNFKSPDTFLTEQLQTYLDTNPLEVEDYYGAKVVLKGTNFHGDEKTISFLVKGEANIDSRDVVAALPQIFPGKVWTLVDRTLPNNKRLVLKLALPPPLTH
jgi:hypothetical protein